MERSGPDSQQHRDTTIPHVESVHYLYAVNWLNNTELWQMNEGWVQWWGGRREVRGRESEREREREKERERERERT